LKYCKKVLLNAQEKKINEIAHSLQTQTLILRFTLDQLMKPFSEKSLESMKSLMQTLAWHKGYCPLSGSFSELSFPRGDKEQRRSRCVVAKGDIATWTDPFRRQHAEIS
jgi:hypothetical protein